jgi:hypothetical protein
MNAAVSISFLAVQMLCILLGMVCFGMFMLRRSWFPIMHRKPFLTLGTFISLSIYTVMYAENSVFALTTPCWTQYLTSLATIVFYNFLVLRIYLLWFNGKLTEQRFKKTDRGVEDERDSSWFIKNRYLISNHYLIGFMVVSVLVFWVPSVLISLQGKEVILTGQPNPYDRTTFLRRCAPPGPAKLAAAVVYCSLSFAWIAQCYLLWKLQEIKQNLFLAIELKVSCGSALVLGLIAAVAAVLESYFVLQLTSIGFVLTNIYASAIIPLKTAYESRNKEMKFADNDSSSKHRHSLVSASSASDISSLKDYLLELTDVLLRGDAQLFTDFKTFLCSEFAIENVMFLEACSKVLKKPTMENINFLARNFVDPGSEFEVNISAEVRGVFMTNLSKNPLEEAGPQRVEVARTENGNDKALTNMVELVLSTQKMQKEVFQMLKNGAYLRFKRKWLKENAHSLILRDAPVGSIEGVTSVPVLPTQIAN